MTFPLLIVAPIYGFPCQKAQNANKDKTIDYCTVILGGVATTILDLVATVTFLIVGILGALGAMGMSPAAAFACIGAGCLIPALWIMELEVCCPATDEEEKSKEEKIK